MRRRWSVPAAADWDEKEELPWPVLGNSAKIGLYSLDFRSSAPRSPHRRQLERRARTGRRVGAPEAGSPGDLELGAFCSSEPDAGSDVGVVHQPVEIPDGALDVAVATVSQCTVNSSSMAQCAVASAAHKRPEFGPDLAAIRGLREGDVPPRKAEGMWRAVTPGGWQDLGRRLPGHRRHHLPGQADR